VQPMRTYPALADLSPYTDQLRPIPVHKPSPSKDQSMLSRLHDQPRLCPFQPIPRPAHAQSSPLIAQCLHKLCLAQRMLKPAPNPACPAPCTIQIMPSLCLIQHMNRPAHIQPIQTMSVRSPPYEQLSPWCWSVVVLSSGR
jgi:hypothetical protein